MRKGRAHALPGQSVLVHMLCGPSLADTGSRARPQHSTVLCSPTFDLFPIACVMQGITLAMLPTLCAYSLPGKKPALCVSFAQHEASGWMRCLSPGHKQPPARKASWHALARARLAANLMGVLLLFGPVRAWMTSTV